MSCKPLLCVFLAAISPPPCKGCFLVCGVRTTIKDNLRPWASCFSALLKTVFLPTNIRAGKRISAFCGCRIRSESNTILGSQVLLQDYHQWRGLLRPFHFPTCMGAHTGPQFFSGIPIDRRRMGNWLFLMSICLHIREALQKVSAFPQIPFSDLLIKLWVENYHRVNIFIRFNALIFFERSPIVNRIFQATSLCRGSFESPMFAIFVYLAGGTGIIYSDSSSIEFTSSNAWK